MGKSRLCSYLFEYISVISGWYRHPVWRQAAYVFLVHGLCFSFIQVSFIVGERNFYTVGETWITSKFLQCNWPTKANTTTLDSKSGYRSSPGRTPLEQQQNAELKFSANNKDKENRKKPWIFVPRWGVSKMRKRTVDADDGRWKIMNKWIKINKCIR